MRPINAPEKRNERKAEDMVSKLRGRERADAVRSAKSAVGQQASAMKPVRTAEQKAASLARRNDAAAKMASGYYDYDQMHGRTLAAQGATLNDFASKGRDMSSQLAANAAAQQENAAKIAAAKASAGYKVGGAVGDRKEARNVARDSRALSNAQSKGARRFADATERAADGRGQQLAQLQKRAAELQAPQGAPASAALAASNAMGSANYLKKRELRSQADNARRLAATGVGATAAPTVAAPSSASSEPALYDDGYGQSFYGTQQYARGGEVSRKDKSKERGPSQKMKPRGVPAYSDKPMVQAKPMYQAKPMALKKGGTVKSQAKQPARAKPCAPKAFMEGGSVTGFRLTRAAPKGW